MLDAASLKRFWEKVKIGAPDECWPWRGARLPAGYGRVKIDGKATLAHRTAYFSANPKAKQRRAIRLILHSCDNPPCCNPAHLRLGSFVDNRRDLKARKGLATSGRNVDYQPRGRAGKFVKMQRIDKTDEFGAAGKD